jgi:putative hydrolase of the HAD superfamily
MPLRNSSLKHIRGIVFDLDDTLFDQASFKRSGFKAVAAWLETRKNLDKATVLSEMEAILDGHGPSYPYMFDRLAEKIGTGKELVPDMVQVFVEHEPEIQCYEGVHEMLSRLRRIYRLGILTDGRLAVQQRKIRALGLEEKVDEILYSDSMGLEKPSVVLFEWFEQRLNMPGDHMMYVGDNPRKDFYGANLRNWTTVRILAGEYRNLEYGSDSEPCLNTMNSQYNSDVEAKTISELESFLCIANPHYL